MKTFELSLNKILLIIIYFLAVMIVTSTITIFAMRGAKPKKFPRKPDPNPSRIEKSSSGNEKLSSFTGIKRIRAVTAPDEKHTDGVSLIVTPWFSYTAGDTEFFEELSRKSPELRSVIVVYFHGHAYPELKKIGERKIKDQLLEEINSKLVLNRINEIYFSEYVFFE